MKILESGFDLDDFFDEVKNAENRALLLDYDGTLAPFRDERDKAYPYEGVREIIDDIISTGAARLVLISGRAVSDLIPLLGLKKLPEIWGSHGSERMMPDGAYFAPKIDEITSDILIKADNWVLFERLADHYEKKPASRAIHLRGLSANLINEIREKVIKEWTFLAKGSNLTLHEFDGGIELRTSGGNKGGAIDAILAEMGEDTVSAYLGDDLTDEDAFRAIKRRGLGVLVRGGLRATAADLWIEPPEELLEFLLRWKRACGDN